MTPLAPYSVCVYCGSRAGDDPGFMAEATALGRGLAERGMRLVYGAGDVGLMGAVADAAIAAGGQTLGVIPRHLQAREVGKPGLTTYIATETMHERKKVMFMNCDAVVALPGGPGTLDELFEALTWRQLGLHETPIFCVNVNGYWDPLLGLIEHLAQRGFCERSFLSFMTAVPSVAGVFEALDARTPD
ncbi:MAG: TIGR00730 family Rossman fold protein [Pseudomonadota bacterium]